VQHRVAAVEQPVDRHGFADVPGDDVDVAEFGEPVEHRCAFGVGSDQQPHPVAVGQQRTDAVCAHVSGPAGDADQHRSSSSAHARIARLRYQWHR
jgi:hypothetical protein